MVAGGGLAEQGPLRKGLEGGGEALCAGVGWGSEGRV